MKHPLVNRCQTLLPDVQFAESDVFFWSPRARTVHINSSALDTPRGQWALLHEVGHAKLSHTTYKNDFGLLSLEVQAWEAAIGIAADFDIAIDEDHIQDCLDTYRNWLYARSTCPTCMLNSLQVDKTTYECLTCGTRWHVSGSRFCRPYRMREITKKTA
jgi:hypothetical protein